MSSVVFRIISKEIRLLLTKYIGFASLVLWKVIEYNQIGSAGQFATGALLYSILIVFSHRSEDITVISSFHVILIGVDNNN